jgi:hypothetical protein
MVSGVSRKETMRAGKKGCDVGLVPLRIKWDPSQAQDNSSASAIFPFSFLYCCNLSPMIL